MNKLPIAMALASSLTACSATNSLPTFDSTPASTASPTLIPSILSKTPPPSTTPDHPVKGKDLISNYLSCEATVSAHQGYVNNLRANLNADVLNLSHLPCNLIQDIDKNLIEIKENCSQVSEPTKTLIKKPEVEKMEEKLIEIARQNTAQAIRVSSKIRQEIRHCFPDQTVSL
jgi:hypothetical protein